MTSVPKSLPYVYGGMSASEQDALGEVGLQATPAFSVVARVDRGEPALISGGTGNLNFFGAQTRLAPFTGKGETKTRDGVTYAGSGGPCGLTFGNTELGGVTYQGFSTAWNSGTGDLTVVLRTGITIELAEDVEYFAVIFPQAGMLSTGRCLPPPEDLTGCFLYRITGTDVAHAAITHTGASNVATVPLTLVSSPTKAGYTGLSLASGGGDLVYIVSRVNGVYGALEGGSGHEHELVWTNSSPAPGPKAIWWPYNGFQRAGRLTNDTQLVSLAAPFPAAASNTEQNWYLKPTFCFAPETLLNGQAFEWETSGNVAWASGTRFMEALVFLSDAEENGWDPNTANWFDPGPYQEFTGATWDEGTLTLSLPGSGLGDVGAAALWLTTGTNATPGVYLITGGSGDDVELDRTLQSTPSASALGGYVGGYATDISGDTWVSGLLRGGDATGPVVAIQSEPGASIGNVNFRVRVRVTNLVQAATSQYLVEVWITIGGLSNANGALAGSSATTTHRSAVVDIAQGRVDPRTEHVGVTVLLKAGDGQTDGEHLIPGQHGWYARQPYNPKHGLGFALKFAGGGGSTPTVAKVHPNDGTGLLRPREWSTRHLGSLSN